MEILITQTAKNKLDEILKDSDKKDIRIVLKRDSIYEDAKLELELDEMKKDDVKYSVDGYNLILTVRLAAQLDNLTISYGGLMSRDKFCVETDFGLFKY